MLGGLTLVLVLAVIVFGEPWLERVVVLESSPIQPLPAPDIRTDYITGVFWAGLLGLVVLLWGSLAQFRAPLIIAWIAKAIMSLGLMLFFDYAYGVDPDGFFTNASSPGFEWQGLHIGQGTQNTQMLAWLHFRWISSSYHASRLTFALLGLVAAFLIYRAAVICIGREDRRMFYAFALMPSILFWSSTLSKDTVTLLGVSAYAFGVLAWYRRGGAKYLLWVAGGIILASYIRVWLAPILLVPLMALGSMRADSAARRIAFIVLGLGGLLAGPLAVEVALGVNILQADEFIGTTSMLSQSFVTGGSTLVVPQLTSAGELARFAPFGMFTVLFRPMIGEVPNLFGTLAGLENTLLLVLAARAIWRSRLRDLKDPLVVWALTAVLLWSAVYSINSFQNLGTAARQRLEIMPLFLGLVLYLGRRRGAVQVPAEQRPQRLQRVVVMRPGI